MRAVRSGTTSDFDRFVIGSEVPNFLSLDGRGLRWVTKLDSAASP
jgi:hypothetical protein